jgi:tetratricopeptide (TPR) repeat protein
MTEIPTKLKDAIRKKKVVILAGAGISLYAGYPSWQDLIISIYTKIANEENKDIQTLIDPVKKGLLSGVDALKPIKKFEKTVRDILKEKFTPVPNDIEFIVHQEIANISKRIITTNYDRLFESATKIAPVYPNSLIELARLFETDEYIFKVHGSIENVKDCIFFDEDYLRIYDSPDISTMEFKNIVMNNTVLSVGFSMADPFIIDIFKSINNFYQGYKPDHYIITTDESDFTAYNFKKIKLDNYSQLPKLLKQLKKCNNSTSTSNTTLNYKCKTTNRFLRRRCRYSPIGSTEFINILTELTTLKLGPKSIIKYDAKILKLEQVFEQPIAYAIYNENIGKTNEMLRILSSFKSLGQRENVRLLFLGIAYEKLDKIDDAIDCYQKILATESDTKLIRSAQFNLHLCFEKKQQNDGLDFTHFFNDKILLLGKQRISDKALTMHLIHCCKENRTFLHNDLLEESLSYEININPIGYVKTILTYIELRGTEMITSDFKQLIETSKDISINSRIAILVKLHKHLIAALISLSTAK